MATRPRTPGTPRQPNKTVPGRGAAAPAKPETRRTRGPSTEQLEPQGAAASPESHVAEAIRALTERVAAGVGTLAEVREEMRGVNRRLDQLAAGRSQPAAASDADDYAFGRDRDSGDAVPPGVAAATPAPLTQTDEAVLHTLEDLPKRTGRGRRGPRAKA